MRKVMNILIQFYFISPPKAHSVDWGTRGCIALDSNNKRHILHQQHHHHKYMDIQTSPYFIAYRFSEEKLFNLLKWHRAMLFLPFYILKLLIKLYIRNLDFYNINVKNILMLNDYIMIIIYLHQMLDKVKLHVSLKHLSLKDYQYIYLTMIVI